VELKVHFMHFSRLQPKVVMLSKSRSKCKEVKVSKKDDDLVTWWRPLFCRY
jgi:hypothetical protein